MKHRDSWRVGGVFFLFLLLYLRSVYFIRQHVVEVFYSDEWDFLGGLFNGDSWWSLFRWQHGSHRMGVGYWVIKINSLLSDWSELSLTITVATLLLVSGVLAYLLKLRLSHADKWRDLALPFLFLNLFQWELYVGAPNPAHGSVPLLLTMLMACSLTLRSRRWRYAIFLGLNFLNIHTGFGYILGLCVPPYLLLEIWGRRRTSQKWKLEGIAFVVSLASIAYFFHDYASIQNTENPSLKLSMLWELPIFIAGLFSRGIGATRLNALALIGAGLALLSVWNLWQSGRRIARHSDKSFKSSDSIVFLFCAYTLLFALSCGVGRLGLGGVGGGLISRYVPYLVPAFFALYLCYSRAPLNSLVGITRNLLLILFIGMNLKMSRRDETNIQIFSEGKRKWAQCYLQNKDLEWCDKTTQFNVHPSYAGTRINEKLEFLREHKLSLYHK